MDKDARLFIGITLLTVPTIVYGGLTVLGIVTAGQAGFPAPGDLAPQQVALYRAGHAHAGVLVILSLFLQIVLEHARLDRPLRWASRIAAPSAAVFVSGGFFAVAHAPAGRALLYFGASLLVFAVVTTGVGLLRSVPRAGAS